MEDRGHEDTNEDTQEDTKKEIINSCKSQCRKLPPTKSATGGFILCLEVTNMADRILPTPTRILQNHSIFLFILMGGGRILEAGYASLLVQETCWLWNPAVSW